jgi:hypothetical protein
VLTGMVDSDADAVAVVDLVREAAPGFKIDPNFEDEIELPETVEGQFREGVGPADLPDSLEEVVAEGGEVYPDFTDQRILTDPTAAMGSPDDLEDPVQEGDDVYVPPSDPVISLRQDGQPEVLGGFSQDSMQDVDVARSADGRLGDEAIAEAVLRELRQDAATTDLRIHVHVRNGVVYLRGRVPGPEDVEDAEEVASRVPGVSEVIEELEVAAL